VQVRRLRLKVETDPTQPKLIVTERGAGYRFDCSVETLY
jgi:DNA-binding response OmpR family regulator